MLNYVQFTQRLFRRILLSFTLCKTYTQTQFDIVNIYFWMKFYQIIGLWLFCNQLKTNGFMLFLSPLYQTRLKVYLTFQYGIDIDVLLNERFKNKTFRYAVTLIKIDRSNQCFEGISVDIGVVSKIPGGWSDDFIDPYFNSNFESYCGSGFFSRIYDSTGKELYDAAMKNDPEALDAFTKFGNHIGNLITHILYVLAPEAIILGGSISKSYPLFKNGIYQSLDGFLLPEVKNKLVIDVSDLEHPALLGAAALYYDSMIK